jgi:multidrug resistance efflux pump
MSHSSNPPGFGFPAATTVAKQTPVTRPTPLPKRPKGRWFIGLLLLGGCVYAGYHVWEAFFRYRAYGTVVGKLVQISPPWDGEVSAILVREGEWVRQGQPLIALDNLELRQQQDQTRDELRVAQANLEAEVARLKWQTAFQLDNTQGAVARQQEALGTLAQEKSALARIQLDWDRTLALWKQNVVPRAEVDRIFHEREGLLEKVAKLEKSAIETKLRGDVSGVLLASGGSVSESLKLDGSDQLKPHLARMDALQSQHARLDAKLAGGKLTAPCNAQVIKVHRFVGERVRGNEVVLTLLEEGSLRVVLYMPQKSSLTLLAGDEVGVVCEPYQMPFPCRVGRLGDQFELAPESVKRHYAVGQTLLPVTLEPAPEASRWLALRLGGVVKLP